MENGRRRRQRSTTYALCVTYLWNDRCRMKICTSVII